MAPRADDADGTVDDDRWAQIVAQLGDVDAAAERRSAEDAAITSDERPDKPGGLDFPVAPGVDSPWTSDARIVRPARDEGTGRDWDGTSQYDDAEAKVDDEEGFVPPDPGPVLGGDPLLTMAWFAVAGVPVFLLVVLIAWRSAPPAFIQAACIVFVLGVGLLLWRMPDRREPGESGDDSGAVV
ncbi:hypothetical protein [Cellulomonas composti]|uniref:Uncharacterized protein n=1 Tax=Cellulomonas composti TaxID=266130 RepID=A0A511J747_9CELL|nr:hypothetical protein [Cellulomonas composti]GEL93804.1 hypothetical protein CCO02nite_04620 [Cellulomonas composti]